MLLYNVTVGIDKEIETQWLAFIKSNYGPRVIGTGLFLDFKVYKVLTHDDDTSVSYSMQFFSDSIENVLLYLNKHAPAIVEDHRRQFKDRHIVFNTLLEEN